MFQPKLPKANITNVAITKFNVTNRNGGAITSLTEAQNPVLNADIAFTIQVSDAPKPLQLFLVCTFLSDFGSNCKQLSLVALAKTFSDAGGESE